MRLKRKISILISIICMMLVTSCGNTEVTSHYAVNARLSGGTGKASIESPVMVNEENGKKIITLVWSSSNYDYIIVDSIKYENENPGGKSTFTVPVNSIETPLKIIADTVAMSKPHEIEYEIIFEGITGDGATKVYETEAKSDEDAKGIKAAAIDFTRDSAIQGLEKTGELNLSYAKEFRIEYFGEYSLVTINGDGRYLIVPEGGEAVELSDDSITIIEKPFDVTYVVATPAMDFINRCKALDYIKLSGTKETDWYIDDVKAAMQAGKIMYAGKYSAPDFEMILLKGCNLTVENTMIYHKPEVREKLIELGIPVIVDHSSLEEHPLGRLEWIKLYGELFDKKDEANGYYEKQLEAAASIIGGKSQNKKIAFFYVSGNGTINVRGSKDYIAKMIELSGGDYFIDESVDGGKTSTVSMQLESFLDAARDADILIYNGAIGGELNSVAELVEVNELFSLIKAVNDGQVYSTGSDFYQETTRIVEFMKDISNVISGNLDDYSFLKQLN